MKFTIEGPHLSVSDSCVPVLRSLPDWFGREEAILHYASEIDHLQTFLARDDKQVVGFLSIKQHNPYSSEVYVMGVRPEAHHQGVGKGLMKAAEAWLKEQSSEYLQVKTLGPTHGDLAYAKTRAFYIALGFRPIEEFKQIWDEQTPCLIMVKRL